MLLQPLTIPFIDLNGQLRQAHALSLLDRPLFLSLRSECLRLAGKTDLRILFDSNVEFREMAIACLVMSGISPGWVDADMVCKLLFGIGEQPALLIALNFPQRAATEEGEPLPEGYSPEAYNLASLWAYTNDLEQALRLARDEPWILLSEVLRSRAHQLKQLDPKEQKRKQSDRLKSRFSELAKSGQLDQAIDRLSS